MELKVDIEESGGNLIQNLVESLGKLAEKISGSGLITGTAQLKAAAAAAKRSLMSFDKLNRLSASASKGKSQSTIQDFFAALKDENALKNLTGPYAALARVFRSMGVELKFTDDRLYFLKQRIAELPQIMRQLVNTAADVSNHFFGLPKAAEQVESAMGLVDKSTMFTAGLLEMVPISAVKAATGLEQSFSGTASFFERQVSVPLKGIFGNLFSNLQPGAKEAMDSTKEIFSDAASNISTTFRNAWQQVLSVFSKTDDTLSGVVGGVMSSMKTVINRLISGINTAIVEPFSGINSAFSKLKSFTVNGTQPFKNLNFSVSMPKIPLLASGAVLPANKPFLAMVGDQKHGTNIEAPLATIEQAVAGVMEQVVEAEMAGHNQTVSVLRQILEAVLGMGLSEEVLGSAVERYAARRAIMTGGF